MRKYEDIHDLVDRLSPSRAQEARAHLLRLVRDEDAADAEVDTTPLFEGVIDDGPPDLAESIEKHVRERFNHSS